MRRFCLLSVLAAVLVAATAAPVRAQLPGPEGQGAEAQLEVQLADTLGADLKLAPGSPTQTLPKPVTMTLTGKVIDYRCYMLFKHDPTPGSKYSNCTFRGVPKGDRIALITPTGTVYFLRGNFTQAGNGRIKRYIDADVTVTGLVGQMNAETFLAAPPDPAAVDTRRNPTRTGEVNADKTTRNDYHEGDPTTLWWFWIEPTSVPTVK